MSYPSQYNQVIFNENQFPTASPVTEEKNKRVSRSTALKPNKQLPEKAIHLMNAWYLSHEDNPYPNRNDLDYLATNGGIKESQVKAWFSNKRNRTQNTHPKRAKRFLVRHQCQSNIPLTNEPEKLHLADQLEQRLLPTSSTSVYSSMPSLANQWPCWFSTATPSSDYCPSYYSYQLE